MHTPPTCHPSEGAPSPAVATGTECRCAGSRGGLGVSPCGSRSSLPPIESGLPAANLAAAVVHPRYCGVGVATNVPSVER
eukprot:312762-Pleurochrysis_carterae.AAC.1